MRNTPHSSFYALALGLLCAWGLACAHRSGATARSVQGYHYFVPAPSDDLWSPKIAAWQARERADLGSVPSAPERSPAPVSGADLARLPAEGQLHNKYEKLRDHLRQRRDREGELVLARELVDWLQAQALEHYVADGPVDHWATLRETLERNGDDCDGLELLTFHLLRELGFGRDRVFRGIVFRPADGQHHMVTFWFEDAGDPWILDPTGAMTRGLPRMSDVPEWVPIKVFGLTRDFTVGARS